MLRVKANHRPATSYMGRFGGGWQLKLGFQATRRTVIISLLVFDVRIDRIPT